jgi:hypothetical protein
MALESIRLFFSRIPADPQMVGAFLGAANRSLKLVCEIANQFLPLERRHQNFSKLAAAIEKEVPTCAPILSFLREWEDCSAYISDLRNFFEHPRAIRTVLHNFDLVGDGIRTPQWHIEGDRVTSPRPIKEESQKMVVLLLDFSEAMFFLLMQWRLDRRYPFRKERGFIPHGYGSGEPASPRVPQRRLSRIPAKPSLCRCEPGLGRPARPRYRPRCCQPIQSARSSVRPCTTRS